MANTALEPNKNLKKKPTSQPMNIKAKSLVVLLAALASPLSWAYGAAATTASLQFNSNPLDTVTGTPETLNFAAGSTFTLSLQIVTNGTTDSLDYFLSQ